jgi:hypothetical protein
MIYNSIMMKKENILIKLEKYGFIHKSGRIISRNIDKRIKDFPELYEDLVYLTSFLNQEKLTVTIRIHSLRLNILEQPKCLTCNKELEIVRNILPQFCSVKCKNSNADLIKKKELSAKRTCLERYGVEHHTQVNCDAKWKFINSGHNNVSNERRKRTNLERYGAKNPFSSSMIQDKIKKNNLERYGVENISSLKTTKEKVKKTVLERYGVEYISQSREIQERIKEGNIKKYGVEHHTQKHISKEQHDKYKDIEWLREQHIKNKRTIRDISQELNYSESRLYLHFKHHNIPLNYMPHSLLEKAVFNFVSENTDHDVYGNVCSVIPPQEIDVWVPELKIGIEFNGMYWHSERAGTPKDYHLNKTNAMESKGYRLIHIFENEWMCKREIVQSRLLNMLCKSQKIMARKCVLREITSEDKRNFFNRTHIQGDCPSSINLGLYYEDKLVACMTFGTSRFNKEYEYELLRYSNELNTGVVGGASKLFSHFLRSYKPSSVISYADRRWNTGLMYENLGFNLKHISSPSFWIFKDEWQVFNRLNFQKHKLPNLLENFDPDLTAWQNLQNNGYDRIWDCGSKVFIY